MNIQRQAHDATMSLAGPPLLSSKCRPAPEAARNKGQLGPGDEPEAPRNAHSGMIVRRREAGTTENRRNKNKEEQQQLPLDAAAAQARRC